MQKQKNLGLEGFLKDEIILGSAECVDPLQSASNDRSHA